jgi:ABC-type multidrug transport system fused ATPase/permease subunit
MQSALSRYHDATTNLIAEALQGIRQIRFLSLESIWEGKILRVRHDELNQIWKAGLAMSFLTFFANLSPILLSSISLSVYAYQTGRLTPSIAFAALGLFADLHSAWSQLPVMAANISQSWISCNRVEQYLNGPEKQAITEPSDHVALENATVTWPIVEQVDIDQDRFELREMDLSFPHGALSVITGKTGSGKSLLLASILGEVTLRSGSIKVPKTTITVRHEALKDWIIPSTTALVSQPPWIENCTIRDNILFGLPLDSARYRKALQACALEEDLKQLADGDMTEVGAKGAMLSGGQRWRVALARALYSRAEILLLDDILSAVDAHVARWLVDNALDGELAYGRTRILGTHHPGTCLSRASYLVELGNGVLQSAKSLEGLQEWTDLPHQVLRTEEESANASQDWVGMGAKKTKSKLAQDMNTSTIESINPRKVAREEKAKVGGPSLSASWDYFQASGGWRAWSLGISITVGYRILAASRSWWLMQWTQSGSGPEKLDSQNNHGRVAFFIGIYMLLSLSTGVALTVQYLFFLILGLKASKSLFGRMTHSTLRAPLLWIDTVPTGQILNRFSSDMDIIDTRSSQEINALLGGIVHLLLIASIGYVP